MTSVFMPPCTVAPGQARLTEYVPHHPTAAQRVFLCLSVLEAFYGGAAGGGKSDALLMGALQFVDVPGYAALILRRTYADLSLPGALLDRAREWLQPTDARYAPSEHTWHFPSGGSVTFGYLEHAGNETRYQSAEFQYVAFDELTQFSERAYRYLASRVRRPKDASVFTASERDGLTLADVPLRMRSASNPGNMGHEWVRRRLVDPETRERESVFIPSTLDDNPHLDQAEYERALRMLDPVNYERLRRGDWDVRETQVFDIARLNVLDASPFPRDGVERCRYWDLASTEVKQGKDPDETCGFLLARDPRSGLLVIEHIEAFRKEPHIVEQRMLACAERDGKEVPIVVEQEPGSAGKSFISHLRRQTLFGWNVRGDRATGPKATRIITTSPAVNAGEVSIVRGPWLTPFLDQMDAYPNVTHDDQVDAFAGAYNVLAGKGNLVLAMPGGGTEASYWRGAG